MYLLSKREEFAIDETAKVDYIKGVFSPKQHFNHLEVFLHGITRLVCEDSKRACRLVG